MKPITFILFILIFSNTLYAQDTTGGTRPNVVIPLHKDPAENRTSNTVTHTTVKNVALTPDEIRIRNNSKLKKKKAYHKKVIARKPKMVK